MFNLLKRKTKIYKKETSQEEFFQREKFYKIIIEDRAGAIERVDNPEEVVNKLYEVIPYKSVKKKIEKLLGTSRYAYEVTSFGYGDDRVVEVLITKKRR